MGKPSFKPGQPLRASDLTALVESVIRRISGGGSVKARVFGDQLITEGENRVARVRRGGGGGGATLDVVQATADGASGAVAVKVMTLKADVSLSPNFTLAATGSTVNYFKL